MEIHRYCSCGATATIVITTGTSDKLAKSSMEFIAAWDEMHPDTPEHRPTDAKGASNARRRQDRADRQATRLRRALS